MAGKSRKSKPNANPVSHVLFWLAVVMFAGVGLALLGGSRRLFELVAYPLIFATSATFLLWVYFEYKSGVVRGHYTYGRPYRVHRKKEPVLFHFWVIGYSIFGIFMTVVFATLTFYDPNFLK